MLWSLFHEVAGLQHTTLLTGSLQLSNHVYFGHNRDNLPLLLQMQLLKNQKHFAPFLLRF